jgi:hypothetical protein
MSWLREFVRESNKIEGILRPPFDHEIQAHRALLGTLVVTVSALVEFVLIVAHASLRDRGGMDVRVGNHSAPSGGPQIRADLQSHLLTLPARSSPYRAHKEYEALHPFMDGNGRSGRVLWLWMMEKQAADAKATHRPWREAGFLRWWYYQSLEKDSEQ